MPNDRTTTKAVGALLGPERRFLTIAVDPDTRAASEDGTLRFRGHASIFDSPAYIGRKPYGFWEVVRSGAFTKSSAESDIRFLHNHNPDLALARSTITTGPGSLRLRKDEPRGDYPGGLLVESEWVNTTFARDLHEQVRTGVVNQMSFSFIPIADGEKWSKSESGEDQRDLLEVSLFDVSTVTFPAYTETDAAVRSAGLGLLMDAADLDDDHRLAILEAVRRGSVTPDLGPALRAASKALVELAAAHAPATATRGSEGSDDVRHQQINLRMRMLMAASGEAGRPPR